MFSSDKPIKNKNYDLLNRTEFSKQLAKAILSYTETDNFTVGLCGKWGSGKTSVLNMVLEEINSLTYKCSDDEKPVIVWFNPWNYSDQAQLTTQFFKSILSALGKNENSKNLKKVGEALQNYASVMDYTTYIPVAGKYIKLGKSLISGVGKTIANQVSEKDSLENRKEEVWKALEYQNQKLIVVIDDIDRLTNSQIRLIFQLVNSLAGFPNMIYLLSFDKSVVVRALSEEQKCNGEEYLEKIIQVPFEIPEANKSLIDEAFCKRVADIILPDIEQDDTFEIEYWKRIFSTCISPFLNTMRDVNRIVNTYKFKHGLMKEETNCIDLLAITTLQICAIDIYEWIFKKAKILTGSVMSSKGISGVKQKENAAKYSEEFKMVYAKNPDLMLQVVQNLFPRFSWNTGGYTRDHDDELMLRHNQRLASSDKINRYFNLSLEDIVIDKKQMRQTIFNYDSEQLTTYFQTLSESDDLYNYLHELIAYVSEMPQNRKLLFVQELTKLRMLEENNKKRGFLTPTIENKAADCVYEIFKNNHKKENSINFQKWIGQATVDTLPYVCEIMDYIERGYGRIGNTTNLDYKFIEKDKVETIEKLLLERIKILSNQVCLFDNDNIDDVCLIWNFLEKDTFKEYVQSILKEDINTPKYLNSIASYWHSSNGTEGWRFREEQFEEIINKDVALASILRLKNSREFNRLSFKFKQIAIAFYLWCQREGEEQARITKDEINAIIPTWEYVENSKKDTP